MRTPHLVLLVLVLLALLPASPLIAADAALEDILEEPAQSAAASAPLSAAEQEAAIAAEIAAAEAAAPGTNTAASEPPLDNENFVPSVQISEDLSVSFPVDI